MRRYRAPEHGAVSWTINGLDTFVFHRYGDPDHRPWRDIQAGIEQEPADPRLGAHWSDLTPVKCAEARSEAALADRWLLLELPNCGYSDYSGSLVDVANIASLEEQFGVDGMLAIVHGSHGSQSLFVAVPPAATPWDRLRRFVEVEYDRLSDNDPDASPRDATDSVRELCSIVAGLADYPLIDDEEHSRAEDEAKEAAWDGHVAYDLRRAIERVLTETLDEEQAETLLEAVDDERLRELFWQCEQDAPYSGWLNEVGPDMTLTSEAEKRYAERIADILAEEHSGEDDE